MDPSLTFPAFRTGAPVPLSMAPPAKPQNEVDATVEAGPPDFDAKHPCDVAVYRRMRWEGVDDEGSAVKIPFLNENFIKTKTDGPKIAPFPTWQEQEAAAGDDWSPDRTGFTLEAFTQDASLRKISRQLKNEYQRPPATEEEPAAAAKGKKRAEPPAPPKDLTEWVMLLAPVICDEQDRDLPDRRFNGVMVRSVAGSGMPLEIARLVRVPDGKDKTGAVIFKYYIYFPSLEVQKKLFAWALVPTMRTIILSARNRRVVTFRIPYGPVPQGFLVTATVPWVPEALYGFLEADAAAERKRLAAKAAREAQKIAKASSEPPAQAPNPPPQVPPPQEPPVEKISELPAKNAEPEAKVPGEEKKKAAPRKRKVKEETPAEEAKPAAASRVMSEDEVMDALDKIPVLTQPTKKIRVVEEVAKTPVRGPRELRPADLVREPGVMTAHVAHMHTTGLHTWDPFAGHQTFAAVQADEKCRVALQCVLAYMKNYEPALLGILPAPDFSDFPK